MADDYLIRPASSADIADLVRIERACFSDPWSAQGFQEVLSARGSLGLIAQDETDAVAGYLLARSVLDECEILNLAVLPEARRKGIGRRILERALAEIRAGGVTRIYLEVRPSNQPAQSLYADFGFRPLGLRPNYYRSPREDGLVLCLTIGATA
ncbi:MAG: ribosomal protein S18-alanine N-acetyltransferase [Gemmatimonadota bacterium]